MELRAIARSLACAVVLAAAATAHADTFLLADGGRVRGELAETFEGPDEKDWFRIRTTFGSVEVSATSVKKRLKLTRHSNTLRVSEILVTTLKGQVDKTSDGEHWNPISPRSREGRSMDDPPINTPNSTLSPGETVRTGKDGRIDVDVGWGVLHIAPDSEVEFRDQDADAAAATIRMKRGAAGARLDRLPSEREFRVETPQASMGVRGTTFLVRVADVTRCAVEEGTVFVGSTAVGAGEALEVAADGTATAATPSDADRALFQRLRLTWDAPRFDRCVIAGGRFTYPVNADSTMASWDPVRITLPAFELSKTEVTTAQFRAFLDWIERNDDHCFCHPLEPDDWAHGWRKIAQAPEQFPEWYPAMFEGDRQPAVGVDWLDAYAFCAWIGARLPSDTQWEWAALTGDPNMKSGQVKRKELLQRTWCIENATPADYDGPPLVPEVLSTTELAKYAAAGLATRDVGSLAPDRNGIHDLFGNAQEWVGDWMGPPLGTHNVPLDGRPRRPPSVAKRDGAYGALLRGIGFHWSVNRVYVARESFNQPHLASGFRPAFEVDE